MSLSDFDYCSVLLRLVDSFRAQFVCLLLAWYPEKVCFEPSIILCSVGDEGSFLPGRGTLTACKEHPKDRPLKILVDNASVLTKLEKSTFSTCRRDLTDLIFWLLSKQSYRKLCEAVNAALHERTTQTVFPQRAASERAGRCRSRSRKRKLTGCTTMPLRIV